MNNTTTYTTKYGLVTLYSNETYICEDFKNGKYYDEETLLKLKEYINPDKDILEIGGHCGTSTLIYASFINDTRKIYVYEPQKNMYDLLVKNINQNNLQHKIIAFNKGVFCYTGKGNMNNIDLDGGGGTVSRRYNEEVNLQCNFAGICVGKDGEPIDMITVDDMNLNNIGFIHCDAQGSENYIFSKSIRTLAINKPVILYENNGLRYRTQYLPDEVAKHYPEFVKEKNFNLTDFCMTYLDYKSYTDDYDGSIDTLLLP